MSILQAADESSSASAAAAAGVEGEMDFPPPPTHTVCVMAPGSTVSEPAADGAYARDVSGMHQDESAAPACAAPPTHTVCFKAPPRTASEPTAAGAYARDVVIGSAAPGLRRASSDSTGDSGNKSFPDSWVGLRRTATVDTKDRPPSQSVPAMGFVTSAFHRAHSDISSSWRLTVTAMENFQVRLPAMRTNSTSSVSSECTVTAAARVHARRYCDRSSSSDSMDSMGSSLNPALEMSSCCRRVAADWQIACPGVHRWVTEHAVSGTKVLMIFGFMLVDATRNGVEEWVHPVLTANPMSVSVMSHLLTAIVALTTCFVMDGGKAFSKLIAFSTLWRWIIISALIIASYYLQAASVQEFRRYDWVSMFAYVSLPLALVIGHLTFRRQYGKLEWLSISMATLGVFAFIILRVRCMRKEECNLMYIHWDSRKYSGGTYLLASVLVQMVAWTSAEWLLKAKSPRLRRRRGSSRPESLRIMLAQFATCQFLIGCFIWVYHSCIGKQTILGGLETRPDWFGLWQPRHFLLVFVYMLHMGFSCLIIKRFSAVSWKLSQVVATTLFVLSSDPFMQQYHFRKRALQSSLIAPIIVLSAIIFQTGRLNIKRIRRRMGTQDSAQDIDWLQSLRTFAICGGQRVCRGPERLEKPQAAAKDRPAPMPRLLGRLGSARDRYEASKATAQTGVEAQHQENPQEANPAVEEMGADEEPRCWVKQVQVFAKYSTVIIYILSQAFRENLSQKAQSSGVICPQSLNAATAVIGLIISNVLTFWSFGWDGLRSAWKVRKILKFIVPSLFFALSAFLGSWSFAMGTSAAAKDAAGRIYTPVTALLSRYILGKFYMWLEWAALIILTLSCMTFGLLDATEDDTRASVMGLMCALASGVVASINSLIMEKVMKDEEEEFVVQNVRITFGNTIFSVLFLFVMGWIGEAERPQRLEFAFWQPRPLSQECFSQGFCNLQHGAFEFHSGVEIHDGCRCGSGIFVGWNTTWMVYAALASAVVYSWATGLFVKEFSSVYRSVADGMMLLVVFFVLTPLLDGTGFKFLYNAAQCFVVLIVPLSGTTFSYAALEMQKVMEVVQSASLNSPGVVTSSSNLKALREVEIDPAFAGDDAC